MCNDIEQPLTPDDLSTLYDLNMMAQAVMEHVLERERAHLSRIEQLEARVATLEQQPHQPAPPPGAPVPAWLVFPPALHQQPAAGGVVAGDR